MSNMLKSGSQWLQSQLKSYASETVTCARGAAAVDVSATIGETIFRNVDSEGFEIRTQSRDYLIAATDYDFGIGAVDPIAGDTITEVQGNHTFVYEVSAPGGEPCYRYSDKYRTMLRVHTKLITIT